MVWGYWLYSARGVKKTMVRDQGLLLRACIRLASLVYFLLVFLPYLSIGWLGVKWLPPNTILSYLGAAACALGLGFALWARRTIGTNWSGAATLKEDHQLIQTGPYALVRHPIYSGFLLGMLGTAVTLGEVRGLLAFALMAITFTKKIHDEERLMLIQFPNAYPPYQAAVARVIPFLF